MTGRVQGEVPGLDCCEWHAVRTGLRIGLRAQAGRAQNIGSVAVWPFPVSGPTPLESRCVAPPASQHVPVLLHEVVAWLQPSPDAILVDGTLGGGGHARVLAEKIQGGGRILGIDRDPAAAELATERLAGLPIEPIVANYCDLPEILAACAIPAVDGILLDLGLSSDQLADPTRGFGFHSNGPLDLRFDPTRGEPAWRLIQRLSAEHLAQILFTWGEERQSRRIARAIVQRCQQTPIQTARELAEVVRSVMPKHSKERIDPATRTFQALRIAVNDELKSLEIALRRLPSCLKPGGRIAVISFHSLEDRPVKQAFAADARLQPLTRKPIRPTPLEVAKNPRARSAKLRVAERIAGESPGSCKGAS